MELGLRGCSILGTYSSPESAHLFGTLANTIQDAYDMYNGFRDTTDHQLKPELIGIAADISDPSTSVAFILDSLHKLYGRVDFIIFNAAVMGLARMGEGGVTPDFVDVALVGNIKFPIMLMEALVKQGTINKNGRVVSISSEGVRAKRPPGG
jgi:NAD(P)-dependent dehydrogenase (short-subunit alcohol dehydrogenase family)